MAPLIDPDPDRPLQSLRGRGGAVPGLHGSSTAKGISGVDTELNCWTGSILGMGTEYPGERLSPCGLPR